jgi:Cu-processing system permease protein
MAGTVAINTFREAVRDRVLYNLVFFALAMMAAAVLVGQVTIGIERQVILNLGLTAISLIGTAMAVFIGVGLVYKEIEKRTLYTLLAKPVRRWEFLVGKFAGLVLTLAVNTALMTLGLAAALFYVTRGFGRADVSIAVAVYFILLGLALVTALALFFSCFPTPMLSTLLTLGLFVAGQFSSALREYGKLAHTRALAVILGAIYYLLPNFHNFNAITAAAHGDVIPGALILHNTLYAVLYIAVVLLGASAIFANVNLK